MKKTATFATALLFAAALAARAEMGTGTINGSTREIYGGRVYTVEGNVTITGGTAESALVVKASDGTDGKRIILDIREGCTLKVTGGNASGYRAAGAGIELPGDMTLYITGKGRLEATGGNAANGRDGSNGKSASWTDVGDNNHTNGGGGDGGSGGGGAGAGIGGKGGEGGTAGSGGSSSGVRYSYH